MSTIRLFSPIHLNANKELTLGSEQAHYVARVLRLGAGDSLIVFDGTGGEYRATVSLATRKNLKLSVGDHVDRDTESPLRIRLVQGVSRGERMDVVVQKATELGVHRISPVLTDFSVVKLDSERATKRQGHWQKIANSACEQCERNVVPTIDQTVSLVDWFGENANSNGSQLILQPGASEPMTSSKIRGTDLTIVVGPEGGFSEAEYERAAAAGLKAVNLGPRVLRTETAALAAISVAQATWGDLTAT